MLTDIFTFSRYFGLQTDELVCCGAIYGQSLDLQASAIQTCLSNI